MSQNIPQNIPAPEEKTMIASVGEIEGIYDLIKNGMEVEKEKFINLAQDF